MILNGIVITAVATVLWSYIGLSFKKTSWGNMPEWVYKLGVWSYVMPAALGILGFIVAKWYAFIGIPLGWIVFRLIIHKLIFKK